ncbi:MAG: hypothetical protein FD166_3086 [Bacteroidetes bacterium]|nr:MAG: hypothetical protein FD166_3086 [Bacteroidota bacterium]
MKKQVISGKLFSFPEKISDWLLIRGTGHTASVLGSEM